MKRHLTYSVFLLSVLLAFACNKGPEKAEPKVYLPDEFVINTLTFDNGTWWAFEDSATGKQDTLIFSRVAYSTQKDPTSQSASRTLLTYQAKLKQTSTGRELFLFYNIRDDYNINHTHTPILEMVNYHNSFGRGTEYLLFNTNLFDTVNGGYAVIFGEIKSSRFVLADKGSEITINGKKYAQSYLKFNIAKSVAYELKDLNLCLVKNIGIAEHNMDGNYSLVDYHLNPITF